MMLQTYRDLQGNAIAGLPAIEGLRRLDLGSAPHAAPQPNQSYLAKQMQQVVAACLSGVFAEITGSPGYAISPWKHPTGVVNDRSRDWRIVNQVVHFWGSGSVLFSNARWDPLHSAINYGRTRLAQNVKIDNDAKTKLIKNDSDAPVQVSYTETEETTDSFSSSVTQGLTLDMTVSSETSVSGSYAGVEASETITAEFGASKSKEETHEKSEEGSHGQEINVEFVAAPGEYYLVTLSKDHQTTYQDFRVDGIMDFDVQLQFGGGRHRLGRFAPPAGSAKLTGGIAGLQQYLYGYDTAHPEMAGFMDATYGRTRNDLKHLFNNPGIRQIQVAGTNQANLESNATYAVQSLGHSVPDDLKHLPVEHAGDVAQA